MSQIGYILARITLGLKTFYWRILKERLTRFRQKQGEEGLQKLVALRQLKSAMIRLVKGELSMRMDLWYSAMLDTQQEKEAEMHANEVCSTSCST